MASAHKIPFLIDDITGFVTWPLYAQNTDSTNRWPSNKTNYHSCENGQ